MVTLISLTRIAGALLFPLVFEISQMLSFWFYVVLALTDIADGIIARNIQKPTRWGDVLDPLADKFLVVSALVVLLYHKDIPLVPSLLIILRETGIFALRTVGEREGVTVRSSALGKIKTFAENFAVSSLLFEKELLFLNGRKVGEVALWVASALSIVSAVEYALFLAKNLRVKKTTLR